MEDMTVLSDQWATEFISYINFAFPLRPDRYYAEYNHEGHSQTIMAQFANSHSSLLLTGGLVSPRQTKDSKLKKDAESFLLSRAMNTRQ
ncbi:hypothetical protein SCLCIDRAFT_1014921 [Scleroderma citrinum Foug A]|uniref:Uncharacterized protein n=1 Tax=Scleroderma citrinum Foug A TaxID=1036808 RepID=A0A0C3ATI2_9AGAM|nr:hypothetical protein SCLCIDRAFT_1014921 [Scleroderma citrinum Foug A]